MRYVFDENIGAPLCRALAEIFCDRGDSYVHLNDDPRFPKSCPDPVWLRGLAADAVETTIVTCDGRIRTHPENAIAMKESMHTMVFFHKDWPRKTIEEQAWRIVKAWPDVVAEVRRARDPVLIEVSANGVAEVRPRTK